ncbi:MAG: Eco57I restriction-modification methylase domain-containing protein [Oscillospiraceae bacterium]|nr:Eco57I restriction-modification methylase domain-containing protein [Oscillospiraceae bacterium]
MSDFYANTYNPDVLSCLANLSNDEVFTPPDIVNKMLDMLPQELFSDKTTTFLDPSCKSGVFLREIAKRLLIGLESEIPDLMERIDHIFHNQLFGIAITEMTSLLSRRSVYCSKYPNGRYSITQFDDAEGNIHFKIIKHVWRGEKCAFCGATKGEYDRGETLESHAYEFIHTTKPKEIFNMKFDVIIGNPPYQLSDGGHGVSAKPIYHHFVQQAKKLKPRFLTMIIPSRWFAGGKGLNDFRNEMLNDTHIRYLCDYENAMECFPGVDLAGGVCFFLWNRDAQGECEVTNIVNSEQFTTTRLLNEFEIFIRNGKAVSVIHKAKSLNEKMMNTQVTSRKPFGLPTNERPKSHGDLILRWQNGEGAYPRNAITTGLDIIDKWNVICAKTAYDHAGSPGKDGKRKVFTKLHILPPKTICTETYIVVGSFDNEKAAENLRGYMMTSFFRFLVSQFMFSQDITRDRFAFVPIQDFSEPWTDEKLYAKYGITEDEVAFIESMIRPMELNEGGGDA